MVSLSFITILFYNDYEILISKYRKILLESIKTDEFIFILNRFKASYSIVFTHEDKKLMKKYIKSEKLEKLIKMLNAKMVIPSCENTFAEARNQAAKIAKNKVLVFSDEDILPTEHWTSTIRNYFNQNKGDFLFGPDLKVKTNKFFTWWRNEYELNFSKRNKLKRFTKIVFDNFVSCAGRNIAVTKEAFFDVNGFNPLFNKYFGEDPDLQIRILKNDHIIHYSPDMAVQHNHKITLLGLVKKFWQGGKADANWLIVNRTLFSHTKLSRQYTNFIDQVCVIFLLLLIFLNIYLFFLFFFLLGFMKIMPKVKNSRNFFVLTSIILLPTKQVITFFGFYYELIIRLMDRLI